MTPPVEQAGFEENLGAFGQRALDVVGARLAALFIAAAGLGVLIAAQQRIWWWAPACILTLAVAAFMIRRVAQL